MRVPFVRILVTAAVFSACDHHKNDKPSDPPPPNQPLPDAPISDDSEPNGLSEARYAITSVGVGSKIVFAGGIIPIIGADGYTSQSPSKRIDIYDATTKSWSKAELSMWRKGYAVAKVGDQVIFAGGHQLDLLGPGHSHPSAKNFQNIDIYDATTGSVSTLEFDEAITERAAAVMGTKAYFAGGGPMGQDMGITPTTRIDIYDANSKTWSRSDLAVARSSMSGFTVGDKLIFAGGKVRFQPSLVVEIYDTTQDKWTMTNMLKQGLHGAVVGEKLYYTVGDWRSSLSELQVYDVKENSWSLVTLPSVIPNFDHMVATSSKLILVNAQNVYIYNPADNTLVTRPTTLKPETTTVGGLFADENAIYLVGGEKEIQPGRFKALNQFRILDLSGSR